jgi:hypothetical protein
MTPEERNLLTSFLRDLDQARGGQKDPEADSMIIQVLSRNPDAAYLLVQHTILADQALHAAQARIAELENAARGAEPQGGGFLGGGSGPWSQPQQPAAEPAPKYYDPQYAPQQPQYAQPQYAQPQYAQPQQPYAPPPASPFSTGGGLGSFLRTAGTTAAGVVGGEMLFEGLSGMFGGHHGGGFGGGYGGGFGGGAPVENVTVNEYNDDDSRDDDDRDDNDRDDDDDSSWDDSNN